MGEVRLRPPRNQVDPRAVSTVWIRDIGAIRHSCHSQPLRV